MKCSRAWVTKESGSCRLGMCLFLFIAYLDGHRTVRCTWPRTPPIFCTKDWILVTGNERMWKLISSDNVVIIYYISDVLLFFDLMAWIIVALLKMIISDQRLFQIETIITNNTLVEKRKLKTSIIQYYSFALSRKLAEFYQFRKMYAISFLLC